jgi:hypothetical protein
MAYTKYSLTPADNNAAPPNGAPEGMLPSGVNDTMRDMMAQIRDVGDGIRGGTYTMTAPVITGGSVTGSTINNSAIGGTTAAAGKFTTLEATGVTTVQAGTVSAPAITTTGDTNTGIFFPAADTIAFSDGGTESMRIDSSGNIGIGQSSPTVKLDIAQNTAADTQLKITNQYSGGAYAANIKLQADNSTGSRYNALQSYDGTTAQWQIGGGGSDSTIAFGTGSSLTERMRIDSSGNLLFNSGYGSVATAYGCRAWVNFNGSANTNLTGTYSQTGTTVTVTITAHGYITGQTAFLDFTSGTAVDGAYTVTVTDANTFTVTQASRTTSGNVTSRRNTISGSGNVSSVSDVAAGEYVVNYITAMPDDNYSAVCSCATVNGRVGVLRGTANLTTGGVGVGQVDPATGVFSDTSLFTVAIFR